MRILACALLLLTASPAAAQPADDNQTVRAAASAFAEAQQRKDGAALERMLAPDYLLVQGSGRIADRGDVIAGFTDPASTLEAPEIVDRLFLRVAPDVAIVGGEARVRGTDEGKPFARHYRFADTFARRDGGWLVVFTQITPLP